MTAKTAPAEIDLSEFRRMSGCSLYKAPLNDVQRQKLDAALLIPDISNVAVRDVLLDWGFTISKDTIANHRAVPKRCSCKAMK